MNSDTAKYEKSLTKATKDGLEALEKEIFFGPTATDTPRTDAELF